MSSPKGFVRMTLPEAHKECRRVNSMYIQTCNRCEMRVLLHCDECKIQVTGCFCSDEDRFGKNEAIQKMIDRLGFDEAKATLQKNGFWVPPNAGK